MQPKDRRRALGRRIDRRRACSNRAPAQAQARAGAWVGAWAGAWAGARAGAQAEAWAGYFRKQYAKVCERSLFRLILFRLVAPRSKDPASIRQSPRRPQEVPRRPQRGPRKTQETPRGPEEAPKVGGAEAAPVGFGVRFRIALASRALQVHASPGAC